MQHWAAAKQVLRYLAGTVHFGITYRTGGNRDQIQVYCDADLANCPDTRRSVTGHVTILANGPIGWKSKLQKGAPATSSVVAEYQALYDATRSSLWFRQLLKEIGFETEGPVVIYEDNQGCLSMAKNHRTDSLTKHIDVKYHFTRDSIDAKNVRIEYCPTEQMVADFLTKPINAHKFLWCRSQLGISDIRLGGPVGTNVSGSTI